MTNEEKYDMLVNPSAENMANYKEYRTFLNCKKIEIEDKINKLCNERVYVELVLSIDAKRQADLNSYMIRGKMEHTEKAELTKKDFEIFSKMFGLSKTDIMDKWA
jgi:hypothetical protein